MPAQQRDSGMCLPRKFRIRCWARKGARFPDVHCDELENLDSSLGQNGTSPLVSVGFAANSCTQSSRLQSRISSLEICIHQAGIVNSTWLTYIKVGAPELPPSKIPNDPSPLVASHNFKDHAVRSPWLPCISFVILHPKTHHYSHGWDTWAQRIVEFVRHAPHSFAHAPTCARSF